MGRLAEPRDVGNAAVWLASDLAAHVTGARIELHGGGERPAFLDAATTNHPDKGSDEGDA
jgi:NAD(P)-dependent dehydrogenase (short-subunit alcohol dehydrogenase family)